MTTIYKPSFEPTDEAAVENAMNHLWSALDGMNIQDVKTALTGIRDEIQDFISDLENESVAVAS